MLAGDGAGVRTRAATPPTHESALSTPGPRRAEASKEAKYDAQYAASKQRLESAYKKRSQQQRIEFGKLIKKQIDRVQAEKAVTRR